MINGSEIDFRLRERSFKLSYLVPEDEYSLLPVCSRVIYFSEAHRSFSSLNSKMLVIFFSRKNEIMLQYVSVTYTKLKRE